jgi:hypothetical protein
MHEEIYIDGEGTMNYFCKYFPFSFKGKEFFAEYMSKKQPAGTYWIWEVKIEIQCDKDIADTIKSIAESIDFRGMGNKEIVFKYGHLKIEGYTLYPSKNTASIEDIDTAALHTLFEKLEQYETHSTHRSEE